MQASKKHSFLRRSPLAYVVVPLAFVLVSTALVFIVGHTMLAPYQALLGWFFSTSEVAQPRDLLDNAATVINGGTVDEPDAQPDRLPLSSVTYPSEGDRYATITITGTNVDAPVYYGDTNKILNAGVGTYKDDSPDYEIEFLSDRVTSFSAYGLLQNSFIFDLAFEKICHDKSAQLPCKV